MTPAEEARFIALWPQGLELAAIVTTITPEGTKYG
jgi:hypothetical protein